MVKVLLVDMDKCTGCKQCSLACSLTKEDLFDPKRGRIKILKKEVIALGIPLLCEQCDTYPCIDACPEGALVDACTYHAIRLHPETGKALICDLCGGDPYCVQHCVPGALEWVDKTDDTVSKKKKLRSARMAMYRELKKEAA